VTYLYPTTAPRVLAHRGLTIGAKGESIDENTIPAFARALEVGATHVESDIQVTADGVAILFHDDDLSRVAGLPARVSQLHSSEIAQLELEHGGSISTLEQVLREFPEARFNLDFKVAAAVEAGAKVIADAGAQGRVLIASFSDARRLAAQRLLSGAVSSAGSGSVLAAKLSSLLGYRGMRAALRGAATIQVPVSSGPLTFASESFIGALKRIGVESHFWTINEVAEMHRLIALGATGIVTDRADLAVEALYN
jgi:glycerophosphoryl diester phosphodiesterase